MDEKIANDYLSGMRLKDIKDKYNCSDKMIQNALKRCSIKRNRGRIRGSGGADLTYSEDQRICKLYLSGMSSLKIASKLARSKYAILQSLKRQGITRRSTSEACRSLNIDETVFDELNEYSMYWIGFLLADGNVCKSRGSYLIQLALQKRDKNHVKNFRSFMHSQHALVKDRENYRISFSSKHIFDKLGCYGIVPNKSKTTFAHKDVADNRHFWRGAIDGDGSIYLSKGCWNLCLVGSRSIVEQFIPFCQKLTKHKQSIQKNKTIYSVKYSGKSAISVIDYLYSNSCVALQRKALLAKKVKNGIRTSPSLCCV
tara:strand:- start:104 stop:1042 length:939 start_codon:yes stop_codon:yes gene_type:complete